MGDDGGDRGGSRPRLHGVLSLYNVVSIRYVAILQRNAGIGGSVADGLMFFARCGGGPRSVSVYFRGGGGRRAENKESGRHR